MAVDSATRTRADDVRRFVELEGLSTLVADLAAGFGVGDESHSDALREVMWDTLMVTDGTTNGELHELVERLWPEGQDETAEKQIALAEAHALEAQMFAWLGTDEARAEFAGLARDAARRAEERGQRGAVTVRGYRGSRAGTLGRWEPAAELKSVPVSVDH